MLAHFGSDTTNCFGHKHKASKCLDRSFIREYIGVAMFADAKEPLESIHLVATSDQLAEPECFLGTILHQV